jgi:hypothetical protein
MVAVVCATKSQDNFYNSDGGRDRRRLVGVLCKKKTRYRSVVVSSRRSGAAPIAEFKEKKVETQPQLICSHATTLQITRAGKTRDCQKQLPITPGVHFFAI